MSAPRRIKKAVPGGWVFRAATGDWTYRRDGGTLLAAGPP